MQALEWALYWDLAAPHFICSVIFPLVVQSPTLSLQDLIAVPARKHWLRVLLDIVLIGDAVPDGQMDAKIDLDKLS